MLSRQSITVPLNDDSAFIVVTVNESFLASKLFQVGPVLASVKHLGKVVFYTREKDQINLSGCRSKIFLSMRRACLSVTALTTSRHHALEHRRPLAQ